MTAQTASIIIAALFLAAAAAWIFVTRRRPAASAVPEAQTPNTELAARADALVLGDLNDPLIEITQMEVKSDVHAIKASPTMKNALQPLLQRAPELLRLGSNMGTKGYRVAFSPAVTRALKDGTLELLPSSNKLLPVARDVTKGKKFVEIGRVVEDGGIRLANVAAMSWQIAAIATAQHFLRDIDARLAGIERGIDDIKTWLEEEKKGELRAAVHLLREYWRAIARRTLHSHEEAAIYHQLDDIERTCLSIGELAREMSRRRLEELDSIDVREWTDRRGSSERAIKWVKHVQETLDIIFLSQSVRILNCQVKSMLPGDRQRLTERIENAKLQVTEAQRLFDATRDALDAKVQDLGKRLDSWFALKGYLDEDYRHQINLEFSCAREHIAQRAERIRYESLDAIQFADRFDELDNRGLALDVCFDAQGQIKILSAQAA